MEVKQEEHIDNKGEVVDRFNGLKLGNKTRNRILHSRCLFLIDEVGSATM